MVVAALEKLLSEEKSRILIDTSSIELTEAISDKPRFFRSTSWGDIDLDELIAFIELTERYANALSSDNILVLPEVISENARFLRSFKNHKRKILSVESNYDPINSPRVHNGRHIPYEREKVNLGEPYEEDVEFINRRIKLYGSQKKKSEQEVLYNKTINYLKLIQHKLNSHIMLINDPLYDDFIELIKELNEIKKIKTEVYNKGRYIYGDIHTDEKLICAAFYLAFRDKDKVTIATADGDILKLLKESFYMLSSATNGLGPRFKKKLLNNPVEVHNFPSYDIENDKSIIATTANLKTFRQTYEGIDMQKTQQLVYKLIKL